MEPIPPPEPPTHQQTSLAVGGGAIFDADDLVSVEADVPNLVRAYATSNALALIGQAPGKVTLTLHLRTGDVFYFDVDVTSDPPAQRALLVGEPFVITYDGVKDYTLSGKGLEGHKSADETQLIVTGSQPGPAIVGLSMNDGSLHRVELVIVGGNKLL